MVVKTRRPDARIVGGIFVYILPEHIWGKVPLDELTGSYKPELPLVGSGPYVVTEYEKGRILTMERNPEFRGDAPKFDEIQFVKYGTQDAVERALQLGEVDAVVEVSPNNFARLAEEPNIETVASASPAYTELAFNLCPAKLCPDAQFNPAMQEVEVRQAIAYAIDRERINAIAGRGTSFPAHGILPEFYKSFFEIPEQDYPYDPDEANRILDDAGWVAQRRGRPREGRDDARVQPLRPLGVGVHDPGGAADRRAGGGDRGQVQRPDRQHRQAHRADDPEGRRQAGARLRHLPLGLGRRPLRPELPAQPVPDERDRRPLRLVLLEPRVRPAVPGAGRRSSTPRSARP